MIRIFITILSFLISFETGANKMEKAIFAGGCFWCEEEVFQGLPGILDVRSGYTGGYAPNPSYEQVSKGGTGHLESIEVTFDPAKISYKELLTKFWRNIDPFDDKGQFCDKGDSYKAAIFYTNENQKEEALKSKEEIENLLKQKVSTTIKAATTFYPAEEYHQNYAKKNPIRYWFYRKSCGRDRRLHEIWQKFKDK